MSHEHRRPLAAFLLVTLACLALIGYTLRAQATPEPAPFAAQDASRVRVDPPPTLVPTPGASETQTDANGVRPGASEESSGGTARGSREQRTAPKRSARTEPDRQVTNRQRPPADLRSGQGAHGGAVDGPGRGSDVDRPDRGSQQPGRGPDDAPGHDDSAPGADEKSGPGETRGAHGKERAGSRPGGGDNSPGWTKGHQRLRGDDRWRSGRDDDDGHDRHDDGDGRDDGDDGDDRRTPEHRLIPNTGEDGRLDLLPKIVLETISGVLGPASGTSADRDGPVEEPVEEPAAE